MSAQVTPVTSHFGQHRRQSMAKAGMWSVLGSISQAGLQLVGVVVLSRLLPPGTFGLMAVVIFFQAFLSQFNSEGFSIAMIQKDDLNHELASNVFWASVVLGATLCVLMFLIGPLLSRFYNEPVLQQISLCLGLMLLLDAMGSQHLALLRRNMEFDKLCKIRIYSGSFALVAAVTMAYMGFGIWALVGQMVFGAVTLRLLIFRMVKWRPGMPTRGVGMRSMLSYGLKASATNFVNFITRYSQSLVLARFATPMEAGFFNRGQVIFQRPMDQIQMPIGQVSFPSMSAAQNDSARFEGMLLRVNALLALALIPIIATFICFGGDIAIFALGPNYFETGRVVPWLAVAFVTDLLLGIIGLANASKGRPGRSLWLQLTGLPILITGIVLSAPHGAVAVAQVFACYKWLLFFPLIILLYRGLGLNAEVHLRELSRRFSQVVLLVLVGLALRAYVLPPLGNLAQVLVGMSFAVLCWLVLAGLYMTYSDGRLVLRQLWEQVSARLKWSR